MLRRFTSIFRLQQTNAAAKAFPFGATHVDDLAYLWQYLGQTVPLTDAELALSDQITSYWNNFQRTGDPNGLQRGAGTSGGDNRAWYRYSVANPQWHVGARLSRAPIPKHRRSRRVVDVSGRIRHLRFRR